MSAQSRTAWLHATCFSSVHNGKPCPCKHRLDKLRLTSDMLWAPHSVMEKHTICEVGCLMSSVAMALNHYSVLIDGQSANPGTLNSWLQKNGGYVDGDDLDEEDIMKLSEKIVYIGAFYGTAIYAWRLELSVRAHVV